MSLKKLADETVMKLEEAFPNTDLSADEKAEVSRIIEQTLIKTVEQATLVHKKATTVCCGHEADMAHKIAEQVGRENIALTANLSALR